MCIIFLLWKRHFLQNSVRWVWFCLWRATSVCADSGPEAVLQPTTKAAKNERMMIPFVLFNQYIERRYPVWLNFKNQETNLNFPPKMRDCCPVIIKTMTLQRVKPARSGNQDNFFFKKNSLAPKSYRLSSNIVNHEKILGLCYESYATRIDHWNITRLSTNYFYLKHFHIYL